MITQERLKTLLSYDEDTGLFMWLVNKSRSAIAGFCAGTLGARGYIQIQVDELFKEVANYG